MAHPNSPGLGLFSPPSSPAGFTAGFGGATPFGFPAGFSEGTIGLGLGLGAVTLVVAATNPGLVAGTGFEAGVGLEAGCGFTGTFCLVGADGFSALGGAIGAGLS